MSQRITYCRGRAECTALRREGYAAQCVQCGAYLCSGCALQRFTCKECEMACCAACESNHQFYCTYCATRVFKETAQSE